MKALQHQYPKVTFKCPLHDSPFRSLYAVCFSIKKSTTGEKGVNDQFCPNNNRQGVKLLAYSFRDNGNWFAPVIEGLLYVEDFTTNWFLRTWPYMEFICTCSSIVNWKIKLIWQRRLLHMSISVEATGKILYLQFVFHMRLVSFEVRSVVTLLKCKLRNELLGF